MDGNRRGWKCIRILEFTKWKNIVELKKDDALEGDNDIKNTIPSHLGAFILSKIKRITENFIQKKTDFIIL